MLKTKSELMLKTEIMLGIKITALLTKTLLSEISQGVEKLEMAKPEFDETDLYHIILEVLCKALNKPWGEMVEHINADNSVIDFANDFAIKATSENYKSPLLVTLLVCLLEHNNILFHKKADYLTYQKLADCLHFLITGHSIQIAPSLKARAYSDSVYADYIFRDKKLKEIFEKNLLDGLKVLEDDSALVNECFLAYINISQFYLFKGEHERTVDYLVKAKYLLNKVDIQNYHALFWYHYTWVYVEKGDYPTAKGSMDNFFTHIKESLVSASIYLHAMNIYASIECRLGNYEQAFIWAGKCYELAVRFYESEIKDVVAESLITMSGYYRITENYHEAERTVKKAIIILETVFGSSGRDPSQAAAHVLLSDIYMEIGKYQQAKDELAFAEKYYEKFYKENFFKMNEVSIVLANMVILGCKSNDKKLAKHYIQKLTDNFPADNDNVERAQANFRELVLQE